MSNVIVSINDFLDSFEEGKYNSTRSTYRLIEAYQELLNRGDKSIHSISRNYPDIGLSSFKRWAKGTIPRLIQQINALKEYELLPLYDNTKLLPYFKEIYLHTLFSGCLVKSKALGQDYNDSYTFKFHENSFNKLNDISKIIKNTFDYECAIDTKKNCFELRSGAERNTYVASGLARLLLCTGLPTTEKKNYNMTIPDWIDVESFLYFACKFKPVYSNNKKRFNKKIIGFYLWLTDNVNADTNADTVIKFIKDNSYFKAKKQFHNFSRDQTTKTPQIIIEPDQRIDLNNLITNYKSVLGV